MNHNSAMDSLRFRARFASFAILALCAFVAAAPLAAQNVLKDGWAEVAEEIRALTAEKMEAAGTVGMSIVLVDGDEVVWSEGFGFSDTAAGRKADADTMFEIGSVSKTFSGIMVMQLAERGIIDIDLPVTEYIPELRIGPPARNFPRNDRPITVRDMMTHHSGLPGDLLHGAFSLEPDPDFNKRLLEWLAKDNAAYPPGYRWSYSNTAVALLENVIEAAAGWSFAEYSDAFLSSLGMEPASYYKRDPALMSRLSKAYYEGEEFPMVHINIPASGSIVASANQMGRYLRMLIGEGSLNGERIVKPETLRAMVTPQNADIPLDEGFAMGLSFILTDTELAWAGPLFWHNGATLAFHSHMEILAGQKLGVIAIANSVDSDPVVESVAKAALVSALRVKRGLEKPAAAPVAAAAPGLTRIDLPARMLDTIAGLYVNDSRSNYHRFTPAEGGLSWKVGPPDEKGAFMEMGTLYLWSDGFYRTAADAPLAIEFKELSGTSVLLVHQGGSVGIYGERYAPRALPAAWKARLGTWYGFDLAPHDAFTAVAGPPSISLVETDGLLLLRNDESAFVIEPVSDTLAAVRGLGRFGGTALHIVRGADGRETLEFMLIRYAK
jgi:CubicO group peptidase (beta-lactamase class C family)